MAFGRRSGARCPKDWVKHNAKDLLIYFPQQSATLPPAPCKPVFVSVKVPHASADITPVGAALNVNDCAVGKFTVTLYLAVPLFGEAWNGSVEFVIATPPLVWS